MDYIIETISPKRYAILEKFDWELSYRKVATCSSINQALWLISRFKLAAVYEEFNERASNFNASPRKLFVIGEAMMESEGKISRFADPATFPEKPTVELVEDLLSYIVTIDENYKPKWYRELLETRKA